MVDQDKQAIDEFSGFIIKEGKRALEALKAHVTNQLSLGHSIEKLRMLDYLHDDYSRYRLAFYRTDSESTQKPYFDFDFHTPQLRMFPSSDADGNEYSSFDLTRIVFFNVVLALDWFNDQYELLLGKEPDEPPTETTEKKKNPWKLTNAQLILMFKIGLSTMDLEPDYDTIEQINFARLMHMMAGIGAKSDMSDSTIYLNLKPSKSGKDSKGMIKDLKAIKPVFAVFGFQDGLTIVDGLIREETKALKNK